MDQHSHVGVPFAVVAESYAAAADPAICEVVAVAREELVKLAD